MKNQAWFNILAALALLLVSLSRLAPQSKMDPHMNMSDQPVMSASPSASSVSTLPTIQFGGALGFNYSPKVLLIPLGDTVKWQGDFTMHPLVSDESLWTTVSSGTEFTHTFSTPGIYHFHCFFHGAAGGVGMSGTVIAGVLEYLPLAIKQK